ncbi:hypothetical protein L0P88_16155 [Muricauda sp. SCSIO 64092]|uniref:hypothetical protein n=1 Tax=Allomuricauda sp. SCSIO 64092 TaxID=2908842 RepID=UPI001FF37C73|nr:hypothetical protein [Muricauda sp. SCSIO 64092]UOY05477.1 hypothetical protein L0P88_16155 [Muricauda sp. SCSIO 64092]
MKRYKILSVTLVAFLYASLGYSQDTFMADEPTFRITKGRYYSSLTFSLNSRNAENEDQLFRQVQDQDRYNYRIIGNAGYAIKDNMTLGLSAAYGREQEEITFLDENGANVTSKSVEQGLSIAPNMRNYIPIGKGQLQILIQTELGVTIGESLQREFLENEINKIEGEFIDIEIGVSPGLVLFFDRHWAFETTVDIAGFSTRIEEEVVNDDEENRQRVVESAIDLRINLLQLNLGLAYYF